MDEEQRQKQDRLAQEAARLMFEDKKLPVSEAIAQARRPMRGVLVQRPSQSLVLRHLRALEQTMHGQAGFEAMRRAQLRLILELLDLVENFSSPESIILAGRIARGHLEGPLEVHARLYGGAALDSIVLDLESAGVEEVSFATADTRYGRLPRIFFMSDGIRFMLTQCAPDMYSQRAENLFTGAPITVITLEELRTLVEDGSSPDHL